jgi:hypothetical protein
MMGLKIPAAGPRIKRLSRDGERNERCVVNDQETRRNAGEVAGMKEENAISYNTRSPRHCGRYRSIPARLTTAWRDLLVESPPSPLVGMISATLNPQAQGRTGH